MSLVAQAVPECLRFSIGQHLAANSFGGAIHGRLAARYADKQQASLAGFGCPGRSRNGYGHTTPCSKKIESLCFGKRQSAGFFQEWLGTAIEGSFNHEDARMRSGASRERGGLFV